jgi:outer membrane protein assembly factor BamA
MVRARAGALLGGEELPPHLRFFGGGPTGVRGVASNLLGPRLLLVREGEEDEIGCALSTGACEGLAVDPERVFVRGAGGDALVEATLEGRVWASSVVQLAAFVDFGAVRSGGDVGSPLGSRTEALVTPGIGIGIVTRVAPVRVDVAYNPSPVRSYPLLARDPAGEGYVPLGSVVYDPFGGGEGWARFRRRLQLQFSVTPGF